MHTKAALSATRHKGFSTFRFPGFPNSASKGKLFFRLAMGRTVTFYKMGKRWRWIEDAPEGESRGMVVNDPDAHARISRLIRSTVSL